ncbi:MAG: hypothetical protein J0L82_04695 [Deltaproteobacteria bacterium]|nr:hypothetical protein [Deltaproteobacteria bacterium]
MKNALLSLTFLVSIIAGLPAFSQAVTSGQACGERLRTALAGVKTEVNITRQTYRVAGAALRHYRSEFSPEFEVYIDSISEYRSPDDKIVGFKISITDGGDESMVDYILDHRRKLVSAYWHNQSPLRFWFCQ